jgi:hypothetical protein
MIPDPKVGDRVRVQVGRGHGEEYKAYPPVPARVVFVSGVGSNLRRAHGPLVSVVLEAEAAPGWGPGDTYRTGVDHLYPEQP